MDETNDELARVWGEWLSGQLIARGWRQADLVRESHGEIKRDRASKWMNSKERPSYRYAVIVANTLGVEHDVALTAAGYKPSAEQQEVADADSYLDTRIGGLFDVIQKLSPAYRAGLQEFTDEHLLHELLIRARTRGADVSGALESMTEGELQSRYDLASDKSVDTHNDLGDRTP